MRSIHILRKPCSEPTVAANVLKYGTGGLNVDETRIAWANEADAASVHNSVASYAKSSATTGGVGTAIRLLATTRTVTEQSAQGRWPANLVLGACMDEVLGSSAHYFLKVGE